MFVRISSVRNIVQETVGSFGLKFCLLFAKVISQFGLRINRKQNRRFTIKHFPRASSLEKNAGPVRRFPREWRMVRSKVLGVVEKIASIRQKCVFTESKPGWRQYCSCSNCFVSRCVQVGFGSVFSKSLFFCRFHFGRRIS